MLNFKLNYILGSLVIISNTILAARNPCSDVRVKNDGDLVRIQKCTKLKSLSITGGVTRVILNSLTSVEDSIFIRNTIKLTNITLNKLQSARDIELNDNRSLISFKSPSLSKLEGYLFVGGNNPNLDFATPKLTSVGGNFTISNCTGIDVSNLSDVADNIGFTGNTVKKMTLNELHDVGKGLTFSSNGEITSLVLPKLNEVKGALMIANNTNLDTISFPTLTSITGSLNLNGVINKASFESLTEVLGSANVEPEGKQFKCNDLDQIQLAVQGEYKCKDASKKNLKGGDEGDDDDSGTLTLTYYPSLPLLLLPSLLFH